MTVITLATWQRRAREHLERVQQWTLPRRERRARGESHPVYDFLFQYYTFSPGQLELWHPAHHEAVVDSPEARAQFAAPQYRAADGVIRHDTGALTDDERVKLTRTVAIMQATRDRPANFGCYGIHEWAMVYRGHEVRHAEVAPLRLPQEQVDALVERRPIACSHFDAYRFFSPDAKPMNVVPLQWSTRYDREQPGCLHANMDLYRWAFTAMPWVGSDLLWECFELATALRVLDMRAGPYDLRALGFEPVPVETPEGREQYQQQQRALSARGAALRDRLIDAVRALLGETG